MNKSKIWMAFTAIAAVSLMIGCNKIQEEEVNEISNEPGSEIVFGASTEWINEDDLTRTEFSGKDDRNQNMGTSSKYERVDWTSGDMIRILCDAAQPKTSGGSHLANYSVTDIRMDNSDKKKSKASISPADGNSLHWGTKKHYFYALYPAPGMDSNYGFSDKTVQAANSKIESVSGNRAKITGKIPNPQNAVQVGNIYKPNMNYSYMYAATQATPGQSQQVLLSFSPLYTALEFRLKRVASDPITANLTRVELSSTSTPLFGNFTATIDGTGSSTSVQIDAPAYSTSNNKITITLPGGGVRLSDTPITVTFLTLPVRQTNLTLTLYFGSDYSIKRTLKLNKSDGPVSVPATKKAYFSFGVPGNPFDYYFGRLSDMTVPYTGGSATLTSDFVSYRTNGVSTEVVPFTLQYSEDGSNWSNNPPSWLTTSGNMNKNGSKSGMTLSAKAEEQVNSGTDPHHDELAKSTRSRTNFDLATYNVATTTWANNTTNTIGRTTANCYVVQGSGTYKIPLVYGNAMKNGDDNPPAYISYAGVGGARRPDNGEGYYLGRFRDHLDQNITATYIAQMHSGKTLTAELIWTDEPGLVKDVAITGSGVQTYLTFSVPSKYITQGNALVAVKANGVIAWSWHIWVTDEDLTVSKAGSNGYYFPTVNVGWCEGKTRIWAKRVCYVRATQSASGKTANATITQTAATYTTLGNSPYYQWGRKDPLWASDGYPTDGTSSWTSFCAPKRYYPSSSTYAITTGTGARPDVQLGSVGRVSIGTAIQHPWIFYAHPETKTDGTGDAILPADWNSSIYVNKWSSTLNAIIPEHGPGGGSSVEHRYDEDANGKTKTIYDPSPVGFRVPVPSAWRSFPGNVSKKTSNDRGITFTSGLFLPYAGDHFSWSGAIHYVGQYGYYWTTIPCGAESDSDALRLLVGYSSGTVLPVDAAFRATACSVRPIRE